MGELEAYPLHTRKREHISLLMYILPLRIVHEEADNNQVGAWRAINFMFVTDVSQNSRTQRHEEITSKLPPRFVNELVAGGLHRHGLFILGEDVFESAHPVPTMEFGVFQSPMPF